MSTNEGIRSYRRLIREIARMREAAEKVIQRTVSDAKSRGPGWVASEVSKVYGIKKAEVNSGAGMVRATGSRMDDVKLIYSGRLLTPTHFSMSPKTPKPGGGAYTLKAAILRGKRTTLGQIKKNKQPNRAANFRRQGIRTSPKSPIMLMRTGGTYIPFQRRSTDRKDITAIKTLSVPQMITSPRAAPDITRAVNEGLEKRLNQHKKLLERR